MVDAYLGKVNGFQERHFTAKSVVLRLPTVQIMTDMTTHQRTVLVAKFKPRLFVIWTNPPLPFISLVLGTIEPQYNADVDATGAPG